MFMSSHVAASELVKPLPHGGDLAAARALFPRAPEPFVDLSTGINPFPYPLPPLPATLFERLPGRTAVERLARVAAQYYGAPDHDHVASAPGTQSILAHVARCVPAGRAAILATSYGEHARAASLAGHDVVEVAHVEQLRDADYAVVVNPNNPDGRIVPPASLCAVADGLRRRGGLLVVDEAFADAAPAGTSLASHVRHGNVVVLRSFGKFFGLAGLRLGFAIAAPSLVRRIETSLGPWAVSGPALYVGEAALRDADWRDRTRLRLSQAVARLDRLLAGAGLDIVGGTSLYRLTQSAHADELFRHLGHLGILVRRFEDRPAWLRWGLPGDDVAWQRLGDALASFRRTGALPLRV